MKNKREATINNPSYRFPGVQPFTTGQANVFFGRERDTAELYRMIRREPLVVLYGKSGLGKSSLLNAGIIPRCEKTNDFAPVTIRFGAWTEGATETPLIITKKSITEGYEAPTFLDRLLPDDTSLWYFAKNRQLNGGGQLLLLFDQFEELFTYPEEVIEEFKEEISELLHTGIPLRFRRMADRADFLTDEDEDRLEEPLEVRQLFGIRSDRMHLLHQLANRLPNILRSMFELKALQTEDAKQAIAMPAKAAGDFRTPPFEWTTAALASLLAFLQDADNGQRVEGILLQLLCQYFEEKKVEGAGLTLLDTADLGDLEEIVEKYYFEKIASIGHEADQLSARRLIEEGLVLEGENIRLSLHQSQIKRQYEVDTPLLNRLVNSRLLRSEPFQRGGYSYELAHDRLVSPVLAAKQQRRTAEAEKEHSEKERQLMEARQQAEKERHLREQAERGRRRATIFTVVAVVGLLLAAWQMIEVRKANDKAEVNFELAQRKTKDAEIQRNEAQTALAQVEKEKAATEKQRKKAEENFELAQNKTKEAEAQSIEAQTALANVKKANADVVKLILENAKRDILKLNYTAALEKIKAAVSLGTMKTEIAGVLLEIAFWHGETGKTQRATTLLNLAATLVNKTATARMPFRETIEAFDPVVYQKLMERYYPVMLKVEGGIFEMGCETNLNQNCEEDEILHQQKVSSFQMAKYETSWWQYYLFCIATGHEYESPGWGTDGNNPAVNVSWFDALEYCNWVSGQLGEKEAILKDKKGNYTFNLLSGYYLPTEAQWEFAAKGGNNNSKTIYSGSNNLDIVGWFSGNSSNRTHPIGGKKENALGLFDMSGNLYEWCWDWSTIYTEIPATDYRGLDVGQYRVLRGGSWVNEDNCRVSDRDNSDPERRSNVIGFRCARAF